MIRRVEAPLAWCLLLVSGCVGAGTDIGNPHSDVELHPLAYERTATGALTLKSGTVIDKALLAISKIEVWAAGACDQASATVGNGPFIADLLTGTSLPALRVDVSSKAYCRFEVEFGKVDAQQLPMGAPREIGGHSIVITGKRQDGVRFELVADFNDRFRLDALQGTQDFARSHEQLLLAFASNEWLSRDELGSAAVEGSGGTSLIHIDEKRNSSLFEKFRKTIKTSAHVFRDADGDGRDSAGETDDSQRLADGSEKED